MPRYELSDGKSHKFWEVELRGRVLRVRYGRIGTDGQTLDKSFPSDDAAKREHDRLVKEKTAKGYTLRGKAKAKEKPARVDPAPAKKSGPARTVPLLDLTHFTLNALDLKKALKERDRARAVSVGGAVPKTLLDLRRVTSLDLGNNVPPPWLAKLPHLRVLKSRAKALKTLPPVLFELPKLKELYLDDSGISTTRGSRVSKVSSARPPSRR
jgi:predicted DNA-binding WGR domain protein